MNLGFGYKEVPVKVIRTDRLKTATIRIVEGDIHVIVPKRLSDERIAALLRQKAQWIRRKLRLHAAVQPVRPKEYVSGEAFPYLGKNYRLKLAQGGAEGVKLIGGRFLLQVFHALHGGARATYVKDQLAQWYQEHAMQRLREKAKQYAPLLGVAPRSIDVNCFKARWGSCSVHGDITFNWRIIMAPHRIVDYVVVHELAHLKHHDHSRRYWSSVASVLPDFRECREWLKHQGPSLLT